MAGCSVLRTVGYGQAPNFAYWRLNDYFDFDLGQPARVRAALDALQRWHRRTQLPDYAALVSRLRAEAAEPTSGAQLCRWWDDIGQRFDGLAVQAAAELAPVALTLTPQQLDHLEQRFARSLDELRDELLPESPAARRRAAVERATERFEQLYGRLDREQKRLIAEGIAASPFDPERYVAERAARHRDALALLRRLIDERPAEPVAAAALRELALQVRRSPRADYRQYQRELIEYNCSFVAGMHNAMSARQREVARERLGQWETDFRRWAADGGGAQAAAATTAPAAR